MVQTVNPILRSIEENSTPQSGAHDDGVDIFDSAQSQTYSEADYSEGGRRLASRPNFRSGASVYSDAKRITYGDIVAKTSICLSLVFLVAVAEAALFIRSPRLGMVFGVGGVIAGLIIICVHSFKTKGSTKPYALGYAVSQGLLVGLIAHALLAIHGIGYVIGQFFLSFTGAFLGLLFIYKIKSFRVAPFLNKVLVASLAGVFTTLLGILVFSLAVGSDPLDERNMFCLLFVIPVTIGVTSISIINSFEVATTLVAIGAERENAWVAAFALTVALVWLYLVIFYPLARLFNKLR